MRKISLEYLTLTVCTETVWNEEIKRKDADYLPNEPAQLLAEQGQREIAKKQTLTKSYKRENVM